MKNILKKLYTDNFTFISILFFLSASVVFSTTIYSQEENNFVKHIESMDELKQAAESAGDHLLILDLYADWCVPCRYLSPILEEVAKENHDRVTVYKVNIDKNPDIARAFNVTGIPYVVYIKNKTAVTAFTGVQPKENYVRAIDMHAAGSAETEDIKPNGKLVNGIRVIKLSTMTTPGNIYVYRGETVKLIIEKLDSPYSIHIPEYNISENGTVGKDLEVTFKAKETGVFSIFCNGKCPSGDGARFAQIVVLHSNGDGDTEFSEVTVNEAVDVIAKADPLILDVRTPNEYYAGHLAKAKLIPLNQLQARLSEISTYKNRPVLVYCRSGNRSTVASQILVRNGFKQLYNLSHGIIGWEHAGKKIVE